MGHQSLERAKFPVHPKPEQIFWVLGLPENLLQGNLTESDGV